MLIGARSAPAHHAPRAEARENRQRESDKRRKARRCAKAADGIQPLEQERIRHAVEPKRAVHRHEQARRRTRAAARRAAARVRRRRASVEQRPGTTFAPARVAAAACATAGCIAARAGSQRAPHCKRRLRSAPRSPLIGSAAANARAMGTAITAASAAAITNRRREPADGCAIDPEQSESDDTRVHEKEDGVVHRRVKLCDAGECKRNGVPLSARRHEQVQRKQTERHPLRHLQLEMTVVFEPGTRSTRTSGPRRMPRAASCVSRSTSR